MSDFVRIHSMLDNPRADPLRQTLQTARTAGTLLEQLNVTGTRSLIDGHTEHGVTVARACRPPPARRRGPCHRPLVLRKSVCALCQHYHRVMTAESARLIRNRPGLDSDVTVTSRHRSRASGGSLAGPGPARQPARREARVSTSQCRGQCTTVPLARQGRYFTA